MKLKYSYFQGEITPRTAGNLAGFSSRETDKKTLGLEKLHVKIVWLKANRDIILIAMDTLYFSRRLARNIYAYTASKFNVVQDSVILNASHTHSAPNQDLEYFGAVDGTYLKTVEEKIKEGLTYCYNNLRDGFIKFKHVDCAENLFVNRRKVGRDIKTFFLKKRMIMLPNEQKTTDRLLHLVMLYDSGTQLDGILFNFSCHPVFNTNDNVSADFAGTISHTLTEKVCDFAMFLQGFAGDVRPNFTETKVPIREIKNYLKLLFNEKVFSNYGGGHFNYFCERISDRIIQSVSLSYENMEETRSPCRIHNALFEEYLESRTGQVKKPVDIKLLLMSDNLFVSIPAEVHSCYNDILGKRFPDLNIFPLGYADGMIGYLPCEHEIDEGGYEVVGSAKYFGWDDCFSKASIRNFTNRLMVETTRLLEKGKI